MQALAPSGPNGLPAVCHGGTDWSVAGGKHRRPRAHGFAWKGPPTETAAGLTVSASREGVKVVYTPLFASTQVFVSV